MKSQFAASILLLILIQTGCSVLTPLDQKKSQVSFTSGEAEDQQVNLHAPATMAAIWKETAIEHPGSLPVRGFTGRIYFYDKVDQPITIDGELTVYGYDDSQTSQNNVPDRKYVFPAREFASHYSKSHLGHSYSVWIPWEKHGGLRKSISLVPVFKTNDGRIIQGTLANLMLSGRAPKDDSVEKTYVRRAGPVTSYSNSDTRGTQLSANQRSLQLENHENRETDSFRLPPSLANRMATMEQIAPRSGGIFRGLVDAA
jgi:hypothetical protein